MKDTIKKACRLALLLACLVAIPAAQQHRINIAHQNEASADANYMRAMRELSAMRYTNYALPQIGIGLREVKP